MNGIHREHIMLLKWARYFQLVFKDSVLTHRLTFTYTVSLPGWSQFCPFGLHFWKSSWYGGDAEQNLDLPWDKGRVKITHSVASVNTACKTPQSLSAKENFIFHRFFRKGSEYSIRWVFQYNHSLVSTGSWNKSPMDTKFHICSSIFYKMVGICKYYIVYAHLPIYCKLSLDYLSI